MKSFECVIVKSHNYVMITLLLIITVFVTREITIYFYKKRYLPDEVLGPTISLKDNFYSMFETTGPWPGLSQTIFGKKSTTTLSEDSI